MTPAARPRRHLMLGIALLATLAATVWVSRWETGEERATAPARPRPSRPPAAERAADAVALTIPAPRAPGEGTITDLFAPRSWRAAPTPTAPTAPPPSAPPLPFTYLGKLIIDGEVVVFVSTAERNFAVRKGDLIDGTYRIDQIAPPTLSLTYLPLNEKQTLEIGRAN